MSKQNFVTGQRWISETEPDLGLGIVLEAGDRHVKLSFPAAGEQRTYAIRSAPVARVRYAVGDTVTSVDEAQLLVAEVTEQDGNLVYKGRDNAGNDISLPELELSCFVHFNSPQERLFAGQIDDDKSFRLRVETLAQMRACQQSPVNGLLGARVQLLPHQLYIADEVASRFAPRVLLADEVGLGKTIEAGLIVHQQLFTGRAQRVLIVVPDSLVHQWLVEMLRRFNLHFTILDEARCKAIELGDARDNDSGFDDELYGTASLSDQGADNINPFETAQLVLCSLSFLTSQQERQQQALAASWDLLLVDEAHHLEWSEQQASPAYRCIEAFAKIAQGLLLLTATPEQLGVSSHFARLRLLDPDRYYDLATFEQEEANYEPVNELVTHLLALLENDQTQSEAELPALQQAIVNVADAGIAARIQTLLAEAESDAGIVRKHLMDIIRQLLDRHGTGRVLFRNTRDAVQGFPERHLIAHALPVPEGFELADTDDLDDVLYPENALQQLYAEQWPEKDTRVSWLLKWLANNLSKKMLVICAQLNTAIDLELYLRLRGGVNSAVFHEGLGLVARDRAAAYFADAEEGAQVLVCSEIGSEGRNFQFAHHLTLFDLPMNPDLLEQRIGRLDRIGQERTVHIHVPFYQGTDEHPGAHNILLRWYDEGLNCFRKSCPASQAVMLAFAEELGVCMMQNLNPDALIKRTSGMTQELLEHLQAGRDRLLELGSFNIEKAGELVDNILKHTRAEELDRYMEMVFDQYGIDHERHSSESQVLQTTDHMLLGHFPGIPEEGVTVTCQRETALVREDIQFLTWEHPMVSGAMDMIVSGELGRAALATIKLPPLVPGTLLLEAIYTTHCIAPPGLQLSRFLPLTTVRVVVDAKQKDFNTILTHVLLNERAQRIPKSTAQDLVRHARAQILELIEHADQKAGAQKAGIISLARTQMEQALNDELERLKALAKVNPNIRNDEIDSLELEKACLTEYLQGTQLTLDAMRVLVIV